MTNIKTSQDVIITEHTTSLEIGDKLKEAGIGNDSKYVWISQYEVMLRDRISGKTRYVGCPVPAYFLDDLLKIAKGNKKLTCDSYPNKEIWYFKTGQDVFQGGTAVEAVAQAVLFQK
jgi:hypothetical protein